jgi:hypothetical protein
VRTSLYNSSGQQKGQERNSMDFEGSTEVDTNSFPSAPEDSNDEVEVRDEGEESQEGESQATEESSEGGDEGQQLTEKGTKLDPNPLSQAHQLLANERRQRAQYEQILNNPDMLKRYAEQMGMTLAQAKAEVKEEVNEFTPDKFKTADDVAAALNNLQTQFSGKLTEAQKVIETLQSKVSEFESTGRIQQVANGMKEDIMTVREKYPVLNPKNPDYKEFGQELEKRIGSFYHQLDFDPQSNSYRGGVSLAGITDFVMGFVDQAKKEGNTEAQTKVIVKKAGKVVTSSKKTTDEGETSKDPGTVIAQRIAKAMRG